MDIVLIITCVIILVQLAVVFYNVRRMLMFGQIFSKQDSWMLTKNFSTNLVSGISGQGNKIFTAIVDSINKYLRNNQGSVIDFGLLKDSVDRHCDSVENDISSQTPVPLYLGLVGTMLGAIIGLFGLIHSDALNILTDTDASMESMKTGVNSLLDGVAYAMIASVVGIFLTTVSSLTFRFFKLSEESGKNSFLAWMQSELLPELPTDTAQALNKMVKNLNEFNRTFADNTANLGKTLREVNQSYETQAEVIKAVHDMDVMSMARANVEVLTQLQQCTGKLELFNKYLNDIQGYTEAIHRFETMFNSEADRLHVLEEIRNYFQRHKAEIAHSVGEADDSISTALQTINEHATLGVNDMKLRFVEMCEAFKEIIGKEKETFEQFAHELKQTFSEQLSSMPQIEKKLGEISAVPEKLGQLIKRMEESNQRLVEEMRKAAKSDRKPNTGGKETGKGDNGKGGSRDSGNDTGNVGDDDSNSGSKEPDSKRIWKWSIIGGITGIGFGVGLFALMTTCSHPNGSKTSDTDTDSVWEAVVEDTPTDTLGDSVKWAEAGSNKSDSTAYKPTISTASPNNTTSKNSMAKPASN